MTALIERAGPVPMRATMRFSAMVVVASPAMRQVLAESLRDLGAADIVEAQSAAEARAHVRTSRPRELCVVDVTLPDGSGIGLLAELRHFGWAGGLVLAGAPDPYAVRAALAAGVRAYVVAAPARGGTGRPGPLRRPPVHGLSGQPIPRPLSSRRVAGPLGAVPLRPDAGGSGVEQLSARELEVLQQVADGRSNKNIGATLGVSALTVKSHLARIARKVGTGDRAEMVAVALRAGVID